MDEAGYSQQNICNQVHSTPDREMEDGEYFGRWFISKGEDNERMRTALSFAKVLLTKLHELVKTFQQQVAILRDTNYVPPPNNIDEVNVIVIAGTRSRSSR